MQTDGMKKFEEPKVEFVAIDNTMVTEGSTCLESEYQTAYQMCGCTNSTSYEEAQCADGYV